MTTQPAFVDLVQDRIDEVMRKGHADVSAIGRDAESLSTVAGSFTKGGKRFRARLAYWGWRAAVTYGDPVVDADTHPQVSTVASLAAGLELFHAAALVHDDIIDNSDTRRGTPAAHRQFETVHTERRFVGDPELYGRSSAILLGDLLLAWADDQFLSVGLALDELNRNEFRTELRTMRTDVTVGQFLDNHDSSAWQTIGDDVAVERAQRVVIYKSAKYSVEAPIALGAIVGGAAPALVSALRAFALPLGFAFQMRDDLLGVFGDSAVTGKPAGDDLREGKRTVLLALARRHADRSTINILDELIGDPSLDDDQIAMLRATLTDTGAVDGVEDLISRSRERSLRALDELALDPAVDRELRGLVDAVTNRTE
ncbi:MAG: polyprenyl synthetase family protein [Microbacteriaceae bacterium]